MTYYIQKHDMNIILDALECLSEHIKHYEGNSPSYTWTLDEVDSLFSEFCFLQRSRINEPYTGNKGVSIIVYGGEALK